MKKQSPLVLVDGSSYLFRAFHALPQLESSKGQPTGAIKGVISMIRKLINDYPDSRVAIVFDAKGKTFRHEMYADYKANRPSMPDELRSQIEPIHQIIKLMGLPLLVEEGVEADDVLGTLAHLATQSKTDVVISTGDKDLAQLVNKHVNLINTMSAEKLDEAGVFDKFGVKPDQIIDYLALIGDTSDNIPGVPKVGPKTAVKWLTEYESLDGVIEHADEIKGKVGENLRNSLEQLPLSYDLARIRLDLDLAHGLEDLAKKSPDTEALISLYTEFEFKAWVEELLGQEGNTKQREKIERNYQIILHEKDLSAWIEKLKKCEAFAFDTETTSLDYMDARLVGVSFAISAGEAAYVPFGHTYVGAPQQISEETVLEQLKPLLEDEDKAKIGQNLKYDMSVLANYDIQLRGISHDTMLESYVLNSVGSRHNMDDLALNYLGINTVHFEDIAGKGVKQITFDQIDVTTGGEYAAEDADITLQLHQELWPRLESTGELKEIFETLELPLIRVLSKVERNGVMVDAALLQQQSVELGERMEELQKEAYNLAGEEFNLASPKQLQKIFFEKLNLPILKKTPKGQPSTAEPVLQELALDYPLPKVIMEYRGLSKLKSTYTDKLPKQINETTGRIHTSYHQAVTATGRLSSSDPNLQNIPIRNEEGRRIRKAFVAPPGKKLIAADYSQIELRIMAHLSADEGLMTAFKEGKDIHAATASEVFGVSLEKVSDVERRSAKAINFGLIYGMSAFGLSKQLNIGRHDADQYISLYFERYPGVKRYMDETRLLAAEQGFVETLYGRRLYLPEIKASNHMRRQAAERTAINAPMQGTAADIIKRAMIEVDKWIEQQDEEIKMIMQVHDELVLEVPESKVSEVSSALESRMSAAGDLSVPLIVELGVGDNWDAAH